VSAPKTLWERIPAVFLLRLVRCHNCKRRHCRPLLLPAKHSPARTTPTKLAQGTPAGDAAGKNNPKIPEMIATLRVGSLASGECSMCHEILVVRNDQDEGRVSENLRTGDRLNHAFEEHISRKHPPARDPADTH
jgi:hypothetical protein